MYKIFSKIVIAEKREKIYYMNSAEKLQKIKIIWRKYI